MRCSRALQPEIPMRKPDTNLITVDEAARRLMCSTRQIWRLVKSRDLDRVQIGRMTRTTEESVQRLIDRSKS